jgi:hypothetical protein
MKNKRYRVTFKSIEISTTEEELEDDIYDYITSGKLDYDLEEI